MANTEVDLSAAHWRKSSYSNGTGGDCVEVADGHPGVVPVRDSKQGREAEHPVLLVRPPAWTAFLASVKG